VAVTDQQQQIAVNAAAARWLTDILDAWGLTDTTARAEWVIRELLAQGVRPVPPVPPLRGPGADADHRRSCKAEIDAALAARRRAEDGAR
jgi:hypothetical protein